MIATSRKISNKLHLSNLYKNLSVRHLSLLECRSKEILPKFDVNIQKFGVVDNVIDAAKVPKTNEYVIKAQVHAGGRSLGQLNNGFKSGGHITKNPSQSPPILNNMMGFNLITKQTPKDGVPVKEVMVAKFVNIKKETYFCILMDRVHNGPVVIAPPSGDTDFENVDEKTPDLIKTIPINIFEGITDATANEIASFLEFSDDLKPVVATQVERLWDVFVNIDAVQLEINPLVQTGDGKIIALDANVQCDDNAAFKKKEIFSQHDFSDAMDGNIGCLVTKSPQSVSHLRNFNALSTKPDSFIRGIMRPPVLICRNLIRLYSSNVTKSPPQSVSHLRNFNALSTKSDSFIRGIMRPPVLICRNLIRLYSSNVMKSPPQSASLLRKFNPFSAKTDNLIRHYCVKKTDDPLVLEDVYQKPSKETYEEAIAKMKLEYDKPISGEVKKLLSRLAICEVDKESYKEYSDRLKLRLKTAQEDAAYFEFLLNFRAKTEEFEQSIATNYLQIKGNLSDKDYQTKIKLLFPKEETPKELNIVGKHFRLWVLILNTKSESDNKQLVKLRDLLNEDRVKYYNFSESMQRYYSILSYDVRSKLLRLTYFNKADIGKYVKTLSKDLQEAAKVFYKSED